ncbi:unnamed protein product [Didymodactylos carnosus]|uniref:BEN domain-containing protein n=2 Tax=Didymodactylos carnosus TaxID=1234261 RepID=A0A8S2T847_9BILA|nr:unnamed protein product [Didymodactylos carnosus]
MIAAPSPLREKQVARSSPVTPHAAATTIVHRNDDSPLASGTKRAAETLPCSLPKRKIVISSSGCGGGDDQLDGKEEEVDQSQTNEIVGKFNRLVKQYTQLEKDFVKLQRKHNELKANTVPRPNTEAANYILQLGNVLAPKSVEQEVNDKYGTLLGIDPGVLRMLKEETQTLTTRAIVRHLFPRNLRDSMKSDDFDDHRRSAIHDYVKLIHSGEIYKKYKINEAINGVFRSSRYAKKQSVTSSKETAAQPLDV